MAEEKKPQRCGSKGYAEPTKKHQRKRADEQNFALRVLLPRRHRFGAKQGQRNGSRVGVRLLH